MALKISVYPHDLSCISAVRKFLQAKKIKSAELSVVFIDGRKMRALNRKALGHDYVTDVITFDLGDKGSAVSSQLSADKKIKPRTALQGEVYVCPAEAKRNARLYGEQVEREILRYVAHGILHLLGHEDATDHMRALMRKEEDRLLSLWPSYPQKRLSSVRLTTAKPAR